MHEIIVVKAGLLSGLVNFLSDQAVEAAGALLILALGLLVKKYVVPLLKTELARQTAHHVLIIADDVTDYFAEKYPEAHWSVWLDRAIDKVIDVTGVGRGPAERALTAAVNRKKIRILPERALQPVDGKLKGQS